MNTNDIFQAAQDLPIYARDTFNKMLAEPNRNTLWTMAIADTVTKIAMSKSSITEKATYVKETSVEQFFTDFNSSSAEITGTGFQAKVLGLVAHFTDKLNAWLMKTRNPESVPAPTNSTEVTEANAAFLFVGLYLIVRNREMLIGEHKG